MTNNKENKNTTENPIKVPANEDKKNEKLEDLRKYVLDEIEEKPTHKPSPANTEEKQEKIIPVDKKAEQSEKKKITPLKKKKTEDKSPKFQSLKKETNKKAKPGLLKWFIRFFVILIIVLIVFSLIIISGVYYFKWDNKYTDIAINYLPLPIALVNNDFIPYRDFNDSSKAYLKSLGKIGDPAKLDEVENEIKLDVLEQLINKKIIENISKNKNIFVTNEEMVDYYNLYTGEAGSEENLKKLVLEMYGWDLNKFKEKVLRPFILREKLNNYFVWSKEFNKPQEEKTKNILAQLRENPSQEKFIELAKKLSEDAITANNGGDLGWFEKGRMIEEFENIAFNLEAGQISEITRTIYGFHIIMVDEIKEEEGTIKARHILIKARDLATAIAEEKDKAKIIKFFQ